MVYDFNCFVAITSVPVYSEKVVSILHNREYSETRRIKDETIRRYHSWGLLAPNIKTMRIHR